VGEGRHYRLNMQCASLDDLRDYDCVLIVTDHSEYDFAKIVDQARLVVDTRNATKGITAAHVVRV
jgi:UDP-N-acetyl-D-glucosamine dehydrogenase